MRAQKTDAEAKAKLIRDMLKSGQPVESSDILNSELIRRLSEQRVTLRAQLAEQSSTLLDNHPRIKELRAQIGDLDHQINNEAATIARSFENDAKLAGARVDSLTASLDQLKSQTALNNEDDVQLRELERDAKSQRDLLESPVSGQISRWLTPAITLNSSPAEARVISRATVSNVPFSPKKLPTILIVTLTTLVLSAGFVVTQELLATPESMARVPAPPLAPAEEEHQEEVPPSRVAAVLGMFRKKSPQRPEPRPEPSRRETVYRERAYQEPAYQEPDYLDPAHQVPPHHIGAIDDVVADLSQNGSDGAPIAVFGAARGLDTSWTALKIARTLAETGSVILVGIGSADAAIRTASIDPGASGLAEYADGVSVLVVRQASSPRTGNPRVHLISSGHEPTDRREILVSETVPITFEALSRSYDYVVVAAGAAGGPQLEDVAAIAACAVLVAGTLTGAGTASARDRLLDAGFEDVTVVVGTTADLGAPAEAA